MDRLAKQVNFNQHAQPYQYHVASELLQSDEGHISRYHDDKVGRLFKSQIGYSEQGSKEHYVYASCGQLAKA